MLIAKRKRIKMIDDILKTSFDSCTKAASEYSGVVGSGALHAALSRTWVMAIATEFKKHFKPTAGYRIFYRGCKDHKAAFKLEEYLYDITIIRTAIVASANEPKQLEYPKDILWHVESELRTNDSRASIVDFGKLLMSAAQNKLMILPAGGKIESWARQHLPRVRSKRIGNMYLAFVPHPRHWNNCKSSVSRVQQLW